jgi:hypothetical protein
MEWAGTFVAVSIWIAIGVVGALDVGGVTTRVHGLGPRFLGVERGVLRHLGHGDPGRHGTIAVLGVVVPAPCDC